MIFFRTITAIMFALAVRVWAPQPAAARGSAGHGSHSPILQPETASSTPAKRVSDYIRKSGSLNCLYFLDENDDGINDLITDSDGDGIPDGKGVDLNFPAGEKHPSSISSSSGRNGAHFGPGFRTAKRGR